MPLYYYRRILLRLLLTAYLQISNFILKTLQLEGFIVTSTCYMHIYGVHSIWVHVVCIHGVGLYYSKWARDVLHGVAVAVPSTET
jgi:hypothetical protein